jgi:hypothetical protein
MKLLGRRKRKRNKKIKIILLMFKQTKKTFGLSDEKIF